MMKERNKPRWKTLASLAGVGQHNKGGKRRSLAWLTMFKRIKREEFKWKLILQVRVESKHDT